MAGAAGLEPVTSAVTGQRSNQLSYAPANGESEGKKPTPPSQRRIPWLSAIVQKWKRCWNKTGQLTEGEVCENIGPNWVERVDRLVNDPETLLGVMNESDDLLFGGCDWPRAAEEVDGVIVVNAALEVNGQVKIQ